MKPRPPPDPAGTTNPEQLFWERYMSQTDARDQLKTLMATEGISASSAPDVVYAYLVSINHPLVTAAWNPLTNTFA